MMWLCGRNTWTVGAIKGEWIIIGSVHLLNKYFESSEQIHFRLILKLNNSYLFIFFYHFNICSYFLFFSEVLSKTWNLLSLVCIGSLGYYANRFMSLNKAYTSDTQSTFLDLSMSKGIVATKKYRQKGGFLILDILNFLFLDGDISPATSYGVYTCISQLIRFALMLRTLIMTVQQK